MLCLKNVYEESSLVAEWLVFWVFTAVAQVQVLIRELIFHELCSVAKKKV